MAGVSDATKHPAKLHRNLTEESNSEIGNITQLMDKELTQLKIQVTRVYLEDCTREKKVDLILTIPRENGRTEIAFTCKGTKQTMVDISKDVA